MSYNLLINNVILGLTPNLTPPSGITSQKTTSASPERDSYLLANAGPVALLAISTASIAAWAVNKYGRNGILALHYGSKAHRLAQEADELYHETVHEKIPAAIKEELYKKVASKYTAAIESYAIAGFDNSETIGDLYHRRAVARAIDVKETDAEKRVRNISSEEKRLAEADLTKALEIYQTLEEPSNSVILSMARARVDRADILMSEGRLEEAAADFRQAAELVKDQSMNRNFDHYAFYKNYEVGALIRMGRFQEAADVTSELIDRDFAAGRMTKGTSRIQELVGLLAETSNHAAMTREANRGIELFIRLNDVESAKSLIRQTTEALFQLGRDNNVIVSWLENASNIAAQTEAYKLAAETCADAGKLAESGQRYLEAANLYEKAVSLYGKLVVRTEWQDAHQQIVISTKYLYSQAELLVKASLALEMEAFALRAQNQNKDAEILFEKSRKLRQVSDRLKLQISERTPVAVIFGPRDEVHVVEPRIAIVIEQLRKAQPKTFSRLSLNDQASAAREFENDFLRLSPADRAKYRFSEPGLPDAYIGERFAAGQGEGLAEERTDRSERRTEEDRNRAEDRAASGRGRLHVVAP
jgi:tetratricopeptide (TPR) repeat protein